MQIPLENRCAQIRKLHNKIRVARLNRDAWAVQKIQYRINVHIAAIRAHFETKDQPKSVTKVELSALQIQEV